MKRPSVWIIMVVLSLMSGSAALHAEGNKPPPNLVGTWHCAELKAYFHKGSRLSTDGLRVTEQDGAYFRGVHFWEHPEKKEAVAHVGGKPVTKASEPIMGVIGFDGKTIYIVEHDDTGVFHCRLTDPDTIEVVYVEAGFAAAIGRYIWKRKK